MKIKTIPVGELSTNCYLLIDEGSSEIVVVDPGADADRIVSEIEKNQYIPKIIINTHGHPDHIMANLALKKRYSPTIYMHIADQKILKYFSILIPHGLNIVEYAAIDKSLIGEEILRLGNNELKIISTPGHSPGGISVFDKKNNLFTGDTIFNGDIGRVDLPFASWEDMKKSINKVLSMPDDVIIYPGHGSKTTLQKERSRLMAEVQIG